MICNIRNCANENKPGWLFCEDHYNAYLKDYTEQIRSLLEERDKLFHELNRIKTWGTEGITINVWPKQQSS
jgi:hypothetical protein